MTRLAEVITPWNGQSPITWTPAAKRLMHEAPEPLAVLREFAGRFHPSGWSGSLADILADRMPLLAQLTGDPDERISKWTMEAMPRLQEDIVTFTIREQRIRIIHAHVAETDEEKLYEENN